MPIRPLSPAPADPRRLPSTPEAGAPQQGPTAPEAHPTARDGFDGRVEVPAVVASRVAEAIRAAGPSSYELVPGRYPALVGLPQALAAAGDTPAGAKAVDSLVEAVEAHTGVAVPAEVVEAAKANPGGLLRTLEFTPAQLSAGLASRNAAFRAGKLADEAPRPDRLPQEFDLATIDAVDYPRPEVSLKELVPGLYQGDLPSPLPDVEVKRNAAMAEVFQRLARNATAKPEERFEVRLGGRTATTTAELLQVLEAAGYQVSGRIDSRIANFAQLKVAVPGTDPVQLADVAASAMIRTGITDALGNEAVVPSAHSELKLSISGGPEGGPDLGSTVRYFQGTTGVGFFPEGAFALPDWVGLKQGKPLAADDVRLAVALASTYTDAVEDVASRLGLYATGYGVTGVCNDSIAVLEQVLTGDTDQYPLLMNDAVVRDELQRRLAAGAGDRAATEALLKAIEALPSDVTANPTAARRALASLPWAPGKEPLASSVEARRILAQ